MNGNIIGSLQSASLHTSTLLQISGHSDTHCYIVK